MACTVLLKLKDFWGHRILEMVQDNVVITNYHYPTISANSFRRLLKTYLFARY